MVDAVGPVNTYNDISINWKKLTASEVKAHADNGEEVPVAILRWAEEYLQLANAPDDMTYDASGGVASAEIVDAADNTEGTETPEQAVETQEEEEVEAEDEKTDAQNERQTLTDSGVSLYDQGKIFIQRSITSAAGAVSASVRADNAASKGEKIATDATNTATKTENDIKATKTEFDELMRKLQNNPDSITTGDLNTINELNARMVEAGQVAQAQLANYSMQLNMIEAEFSQYMAAPPVATDYGTETVDIGSKLVTSNEQKQNLINNAASKNAGNDAIMAALDAAKISTFRFMFSSHYRMGLKAIAAGGVALDMGANGLETVTGSQARNHVSISTVNDAKSAVENITGVEALSLDTDTNPKTNAKREEETLIKETKQKNEEQTKDGDENKNSPKVTDYNEDKDKKNIIKKSEEQKQKEVGAIKDTNLITDSLEIKRRKKEQGLA